MRIERTPAFLRCLRRLNVAQRGAVDAALEAIRDSFGRPHLHSGLGIRHLRRHWFECRVGLDLRLVFLAGKGALTFHLCGNHDDVRRFLRRV